MSKYGTIPASTSPTPTPEGGGSTALDDPGSFSANRCRPWRELVDPSALSVPVGFADAYHRALANHAYFAANYNVIFLVVFLASLFWVPPIRVSMVFPCFFTLRSKIFPVHLALTLLLLVLIGDKASVLVSLPVGFRLVLVHAVLRLPTDSVDEEAGRGSATVLPSTS